MKCSMCGHNFNSSECESSCGGCLYSKGCDLVCCPNCGFKVVPEQEQTDVIPLSSVRKLTEGVIVNLKSDDRKILRTLISMGMLPGKKFFITQHFPSYILEIGRSRFTMDKNLASNILITI